MKIRNTLALAGLAVLCALSACSDATAPVAPAAPSFSTDSITAPKPTASPSTTSEFCRDGTVTVGSNGRLECVYN